MLALRIKLLYMTIILVLNKDKTFDFNSDDVNYNGTYSIKKDIITLSFSDDLDGKHVNSFNQISFHFNDKKLCLNDKCNNYLVKKDDNNIYVYDFNNISYIKYADYKNIVSNKEDALVVVTRNDVLFVWNMMIF